MDKKVLLVNLPFVFNKENIFHEVKDYNEHLGIESLASMLREKNISVTIIDAHRDKMSIKDILTEFNKDSYSLIGFSLFSFSIPILKKICPLIKKLNPTVHITCGGHFVTGAYERILRSCNNLDSVIRGEGEYAVVELAECIFNNSEWKNIKGLAYYENNVVKLTGHRELIRDLDQLPFPARDFLDSTLKKKHYINTINVYSSRGCYGTCNFCSIKAFYEINSASWRARSAKNVVDELELLNKKYKPNLFMFVDDNFIGIGSKGEERAKTIAKEIIKRKLNIAFMISCRVNDVKPEIFEMLIKAGLKEVFLGVESFSNNELKYFNKGVNCEINCRAISYLLSKNIIVSPGFIMFTPHTRLTDISKNIKFLSKYGLLDNAVKFNFLGRVIGSAFDKSEEKGLFKEDYDLIKSSMEYKPCYNYFDQKTKQLVTYMDKDFWSSKSLCITEFCSRLKSSLNLISNQGLDDYLMSKYVGTLNDLSFEMDVQYIKNIISIISIELSEEQELKTNIIREEWKKRNKFLRKELKCMSYDFVNKKFTNLWKFTLDKDVIKSCNNELHKYENRISMTHIVLDEFGENLINALLQLDYCDVKTLVEKLEVKEEDTIYFISQLLDRDIIRLLNSKYEYANKLEKNTDIVDSVIYKYTNPKDIVNVGVMKSIRKKSSNSIVFDVLNIDTDLLEFIKIQRDIWDKITIRTKLDNMDLVEPFVDFVDQIVFVLEIYKLDELKDQMSMAYSNYTYRMAEEIVFAVKYSDFSVIKPKSDLDNLKLIIDKETNYQSFKEVKEQLMQNEEYTNKLVCVDEDMKPIGLDLSTIGRKRYDINDNISYYAI